MHRTPNTYAVLPREVLMHDDERTMLATESAALIDTAFVYHDFSETISTVNPVELHADRQSPPNTAFSIFMPQVYKKAKAMMSVNYCDGIDQLTQAKVILYNQNNPTRSELIIVGDEFDQQTVDVDDPQFSLVTHDKTRNEPNTALLDSIVCSDILYGLVKQAYPEKVIPKKATMLEYMRMLIAASDQTAVERSLEQSFTHSANIGSVTIRVANTTVHKQGEPSTHTSHSVDMETTQPLDGASAATTLHLGSSRSGVRTTFGIAYDHAESSDDDIDRFEHLLVNETAAYNDLEISYPSRFGEQVLRGLHLLVSYPDGYTVEQS